MKNLVGSLKVHKDDLPAATLPRQEDIGLDGGVLGSTGFFFSFDGAGNLAFRSFEISR